MTCSLCSKPEKFQIRRIKTGKWMNVCGVHDNFIGIENLVQQGLTRKEAKKINQKVKEVK